MLGNRYRCFRPETVAIVLPGPAMHAIQVTRFNFTNQLLQALLTDHALFVNLDNLDENLLVDPFAKYASPVLRQLSAVNSGYIYNL
jgi:hypothetical protein